MLCLTSFSFLHIQLACESRLLVFSVLQCDAQARHLASSHGCLAAELTPSCFQLSNRLQQQQQHTANRTHAIRLHRQNGWQSQGLDAVCESAARSKGCIPC